LIQIKAGHGAGKTIFSDLSQCRIAARPQNDNMWQSISNAPPDRNLELAVIDKDGTHALVFACRRIPNGWMKVETGERVDVRPTHWRPWQESPND
jgi:hypothetical protein